MSWALRGERRAVGWGAAGPGGKRHRYPRQNEESERGLEAGGSEALQGHHAAPGGLHGQLPAALAKRVAAGPRTRAQPAAPDCGGQAHPSLLCLPVLAGPPPAPPPLRPLGLSRQM